MSYEGWARALDELEASVLEAEVLVRGGSLTPTPWTPPPLAGTLPPALADRARDLLAREQALLDLLPGVLRRMRQQRSLSDRFGQLAGRPRGSVYVDQTA